MSSISETEILPEIGSASDWEAGASDRRQERRASERASLRTPTRTQGGTPSLFDLLRSRDGLRQALILQEILGPPKGQQ